MVILTTFPPPDEGVRHTQENTSCAAHKKTKKYLSYIQGRDILFHRHIVSSSITLLCIC